ARRAETAPAGSRRRSRTIRPKRRSSSFSITGHSGPKWTRQRPVPVATRASGPTGVSISAASSGVIPSAVAALPPPPPSPPSRSARRGLRAPPHPPSPPSPAMPVLPTRVDRHSEIYRANRDGMLTRLAEIDGLLARARADGGGKYVARHRARGKLLPRERIELLMDRVAPFRELSPLAANGTEFDVGAAVVTGVGVVSGVECVLCANDPTVRGGATNPYSPAKTLRAMEIARKNRLPFVVLVESGGADLSRQAEIFVPGGAVFKNLTQLSAAGIPTLAIVFGSSTAGGAYLPAMCDHTVLVADQAKVFLGGPP